MRLTRDGAPVVIHDATLDRTTDLTGPVRARTLAELRGADAGHWFTPDGGHTFPFRAQGVRIPTLAEVLWAFPAMPVLIEVKEPEVQEAVRRVLLEGTRPSAAWWRRSTRARSSCSASSPSRAARRGPRSRRSTGRLFCAGCRAPRATGCSRCRSAARAAGADPGVRARGARARRPVHVWTVNDAATARRLWARGVAGIVTDVPDVIRAARDATSS